MSGGCSSCTQLSYLNYIYLTKQTYDMIQFTYFNLSFRIFLFSSFGISEVDLENSKTKDGKVSHLRGNLRRGGLLLLKGVFEPGVQGKRALNDTGEELMCLTFPLFACRLSKYSVFRCDTVIRASFLFYTLPYSTSPFMFLFNSFVNLKLPTSLLNHHSLPLPLPLPPSVCCH